MSRATLVLGDEQEGLCRPRIRVRLLMLSNLENSRVRSTLHQAIRHWTRVPSGSTPLQGI